MVHRINQELNPPKQASDYFFPWATIVACAVCILIYRSPSVFSRFFYKELWLTATLICVGAYWVCVLVVQWLESTPAPISLQRVVGDTTSLVLSIALGYGLFLLGRRMIEGKHDSAS